MSMGLRISGKGRGVPLSEGHEVMQPGRLSSDAKDVGFEQRGNTTNAEGVLGVDGAEEHAVGASNRGTLTFASIYLVSKLLNKLLCLTKLDKKHKKMRLIKLTKLAKWAASPQHAPRCNRDLPFLSTIALVLHSADVLPGDVPALGAPRQTYFCTLHNLAVLPRHNHPLVLPLTLASGPTPLSFCTRRIGKIAYNPLSKRSVKMAVKMCRYLKLLKVPLPLAPLISTAVCTMSCTNIERASGACTG